MLAEACYTAGPVLPPRRPDPYPWSSATQVFHVFVCAAATCQYIAIACSSLISGMLSPNARRGIFSALPKPAVSEQRRGS